MKTKLLLLTAIALNVTVASAQVGDISGRYRCVQMCKGGRSGPAFITHAEGSVDDFELVNEVGVPARAWIDAPGHMWIQDWKLGALFGFDGLTIRFDNGTVWRRYTTWEEYLPANQPYR
jgi:hypothetical protein